MSSTYCEVALPVPLRSLFTYEIPERLTGIAYVNRERSGTGNATSQ